MVNVNDSPVKAVVTAVPDDLTIRALRPYFMASTEITDDFRIANLPTGLYTIHYTKLGYVSQVQETILVTPFGAARPSKFIMSRPSVDEFRLLKHTSDKP